MGTRMLIKATDQGNFVEVRRLVVEGNGQVLLESNRRLTLSAVHLDDSAVDRIKGTGATIRPELAFAPDF